MLMHLPFMGAGIRLEEDENPMEVKYQAAHHELVASALAVKMAHEICPGSQVGCMLAAGDVYPYSCDPKDVWASVEKNREKLLFYRHTSQGEIILLMLKNYLNGKIFG